MNRLVKLEKSWRAAVLERMARIDGADGSLDASGGLRGRSGEGGEKN
jgi:hypothetical protein